MAAVQFLQRQQTAHPDLAGWYSEMADLYQQKLWHQLTVKLEQFLALAIFQAGDTLIELYQNFITDFETKINLLKLAHFAVIISRQYSDKESAMVYLQDVMERIRASKGARKEEPVLYVMMQVAALKLQGGDQEACKNLLEEGRSTLDTLTDVDSSVHASVHWVSSQYHKSKQDFAEFYKSALLYLAYTSIDTLSEPFKLDLAVDLSLAALLGEKIYNFGEFLAHPIVKSMEGTTFEWLYHILQAFYAGDLTKYDELCQKYATQLNAQPALVQKERQLREKITILSLMELIFSLPTTERAIPLSTIAERTKLPVDGVEMLLMKTLSVNLIKGVIDQVDGIVRVSWVQPRILSHSQIGDLKERLQLWIDKVNSGMATLEDESQEILRRTVM